MSSYLFSGVKRININSMFLQIKESFRLRIIGFLVTFVCSTALLGRYVCSGFPIKMQMSSEFEIFYELFENYLQTKI